LRREHQEIKQRLNAMIRQNADAPWRIRVRLDVPNARTVVLNA
jgi:hypothetical protein